jgi:hypothetical protein
VLASTTALPIQVYGELITNEATPTPTATTEPCGAGGLVGYWAMDEGSGITLYDSSSPANNATTANSPTWVSPGKVGPYALSLNGTSQYASVPDDSCLQITGSLTIAAWIAPSKTATQRIAVKAIQNSIGGYELSLSSANKVFFRLNNVSSTTGYRIDSGSSYPTNGTTWMHVVATYDSATTQMKLYINGTLETTGSPGPTSIMSNSQPLSIGRQNDGTNYYGGKMDELRVYNRALSAAEVSDLYNYTPPPTSTPTSTPVDTPTDTPTPAVTPTPTATPFCGSDGLVVRYQMEENGGMTLDDSSPPDDDAAITGAPAWVAGKVGSYALSLNGSTYAAATDNDCLDPGTAMTLSAWIKPTGSGNATQYLIKKAVIDNTDGYELSLSNAGRVFVRFNQKTNANTYRINSATSYPLNGSAWMHVAATYDGTIMRLYVNGVEECRNPTDDSQCSNKAGPPSIAANGLALAVGAESNGNTKFLGFMDEARVYNRALSPAEIAELAATPPTPTATETATPLPTDTPTPTPIFTPTETPLPTATSTPTESPTPTITPTPPFCGADGLVARYMMEENGGMTLEDASPPENDAAVTGTPAWVSGVVGSHALYLDGSTYAKTTVDDPCLNITGPITVAAWVKPGQQTTQDLVKKATNGSVNGFELSLAQATSTKKPFFRLNQATSGDTYRINGTTDYPYDGNTWFHLAGTYDGTTMRIYYNGVMQASLAGPPSIASNALPLSIGAESSGARAFKGALDEVRVYNRALSDAEIAELAATPPTPTPTSTATPVVTDTPTPTPTATSLPPDVPVLNGPTDGATNVSTSPTLDVRVSDPESDPLTVTFYGRPAVSTPPSDFTLVVLPDTQSYVSNPSYSPIFGAQTQWVASTKGSLNTVFVTHVGDIVESIDASAQEWIDASGYMATLDNNGVRSNVAPGNHDMSATGFAAKFDEYFPESRYQGFSWYGGYLGFEPLYDFVNRHNKDNYELFSVGPLGFIVIHLEDDVPSYALNWADRILDRYPDRRAIISTHAFLSASGSRQTSVTYRTDDGNSAETVWQQLVKPHCNVFLVVSGHQLGEARRSDLNDCGKPVYQVLQDYQGRANGGDGWLRYFTFAPAENKIYAYTYSPTRNGGSGEFETDANSQFTLDYDMQGSGEFQVIAMNNNVPSGSDTTAVWQSLAEGTEYEWYATVSDGSQTTTGPIWTFTTENPPTVTPEPTETFTPTPTETAVPTPTPTDTPMPLPTETPVPAPTETPQPTATYTPTPTETATPAETPTPTATPFCGEDGLIIHYAMDENGGTTLVDSAPPANTGTIYGAPTWVPGVHDHALYFHGASDYVRSPDDYCLDVQSALTIALWVKPEQLATQDMVKKAVKDTVDGYEITLATGSGSPSPNKVFFRLNDATSGNTYRVASTTNYPTDGNTWIHVAGTYDGTTMRIYYNGALQGSVAGPPAINTNNEPLRVGQNDASRFFKGAMDDVRVYNRALSGEEIAGLAALPPTPTPTETYTPMPTETYTPTPTETYTPMPTETYTPTPTETPVPTPTPTATLCSGDTDCDGIPDAVDNCPMVYNPDQKNSDSGARPAGPQIPGSWASNPATDKLGDACDPDDDNDGLPDALEFDDHCPYRTVADSDGDGAVDGYEVANGYEPCNPASRPTWVGGIDGDSDGLVDAIERGGYNTCAFTADTTPGWSNCTVPRDSDGDGCSDTVEVLDLNGDRTTDSGDQLILNLRVSRKIPADPVSDAIFDVTKDGFVDSGDQLLMNGYNCLTKHSQLGCPVCPSE